MFFLYDVNIMNLPETSEKLNQILLRSLKTKYISYLIVRWSLKLAFVKGPEIILSYGIQHEHVTFYQSFKYFI